MSGNVYRDRIAAYVLANFGAHGLIVYKEVPLGTTIIGKHRRIDVFVRSQSSKLALGIECKFQSSSGTTDEKIPYALQDLEAMWIPGCLAYGGNGWSTGVLHTLEASRLAARCEPDDKLTRSKATKELDHVIASVFGLWDIVLAKKYLVKPSGQLTLPGGPLARSKPEQKSKTASKTANKKSG
jgi:hypothetical protein